MRKITRKAMTVTAVAATAAALTAVPASAMALTADVTLDGVTTPAPPGTTNAAVKGASVGNVGGFNLDRPSALSCTPNPGAGIPALAATGTARVGLDQTDLNGLATLSDVNFNNPCTANGSIPVNVMAKGLPWSFDADPAVPTASGVTSGKVSGVKFVLDAYNLGCKVEITAPDGTGGFVEGSYTNPGVGSGDAGALNLAAGTPTDPKNNLKVTDVISGPGSCPVTLIQLGDRMVVTGTAEVRGDVDPANPAEEGPIVTVS